MPVSLLFVFLFVCRSVCQSLYLSLCSSFWLSLDLCLSVCPSGCLFFCLSVCVTFCLFACVSVFLLVCLPLCSFNYLFYEPLFLSVFLPKCPSVSLSDSLFVFLFVYLSLSVFLPECSSVFLSFGLSLFLFVCRSVFLSVYIFVSPLTVYQVFPYICWAVCCRCCRWGGIFVFNSLIVVSYMTHADLSRTYSLVSRIIWSSVSSYGIHSQNVSENEIRFILQFLARTTI